MTISKKLTALFAGVLLAGSFGLAGCDNSDSNAGANNSSNTTTENPDAPSGIPQDPRCEVVDGEYQEDEDGYPVICFGNSGVRMPLWKDVPHNMETYEKYKYYFDTYCRESIGAIEGKTLFICESQNPNYMDPSWTWDD